VLISPSVSKSKTPIIPNTKILTTAKANLFRKVMIEKSTPEISSPNLLRCQSVISA